MKFVFFGTPRFAEIVLEQLINANLVPALVVCNPDKITGRKKVLTAPPVKLLALRHGIKVWQSVKLNADAPELKDNWDFFVVAAYAKIIPQAILDIPRKGVLGVHPSLLPKYRGASPIQSVILNGEHETGVTIYLLDDKVDHGPVLANRKSQIAESDSFETLVNKLASLGGNLLAEVIPQYIEGKIEPIAQNHDDATFTKKFTTEDGFVDLKKDSADLINNKVHALNPEPGVFTFIEKDNKKIRVKISESELQDGKLLIKKIQVEGKKITSDLNAIKTLFD